MKPMNHVVMVSGGLGSWGAAKRVVERFGTGDTWGIFTDTSMEDDDLYRFLRDGLANIGFLPGHFVWHKDGRTPWGVFHDEGMIGNTRTDLCSRILKREPARRIVEDNFDPDNTTIYLGHGWDEQHRIDKAKRNWSPYALDAPMAWEPYFDREDMLAWLALEGIEPPRLYALGFPHNNCGGFCVRAGQGQFRLLLDTMPERYAYHENQEREFRERTGKDVAILRDRRGGVTKPLTLDMLRQRHDMTQDELDDWGGCGCFTDT